MNGEELAGGVYGTARIDEFDERADGEIITVHTLFVAPLASDALAPRGEDGEVLGGGW